MASTRSCKKRRGEFHIRARERQDLQNLIDRVPLAGCTVVDTPEADYAARIVTEGETVRSVMRFLADTLDYPNFKAKIVRTPDQARKPYHEVWDVMAGALGAYGSPGQQRNASSGSGRLGAMAGFLFFCFACRGGVVAGPPAGAQVYVVGPGETLESVALLCHTTRATPGAKRAGDGRLRGAGETAFCRRFLSDARSELSLDTAAAAWHSPVAGLD